MSGQFYCTACGAVGKPRVRNRGSSATEIILWCCFIAPGFLYALWRMGRKDRFCRACRAPNPIPVDSPIAQQALNGHANYGKAGVRKFGGGRAA